jgi:3-oxoacyl-[acyl-carrier protein] reductase
VNRWPVINPTRAQPLSLRLEQEGAETMQLSGKRAIVTGGLTGIGRATVIEMVREGAAVVSMSRRGEDDETTVRVLAEARAVGDGPVKHLKVDVSDQDSVEAATSAAVQFLGRLDVLVNCAGIAVQASAEDLNAKLLYDDFAVHVMGTAFTNAAAFRHFTKGGGGSIINYASYSGVCGTPGMPSYGAAKGAVVAYSRTIAKDWARHNIRVNIVCPAVMTELVQSWSDAMDEERRAQMDAFFEASIPLGGRLGDVIDAAYLNVFLASDRAKFIHGQLIGVDGGFLMTR